jgi:15-cis-phytoene desaturase
MFTDPAVGKRDLLSNARLTWAVLRMSNAQLVELDEMNALGFLRSMGVTTRMIERFWSFVCMSILNVPIELCSAGALMRFYRDLAGHRNVKVGLPGVGLGDLFAPQAKAAIEALGGKVYLRKGVRHIAGNKGRATGVEFEDGRTLQARFIVAAVPPGALRRIARGEWQKMAPFADLVHFEPCPYVSTQIWFDRKLTDQTFWARVHQPNDLNCDFYDLSNLPAWSKDRSIIACNAIWSHRAVGMSDEEVVATTLREIREFLPQAQDAGVEHSVVNRIPMAIHCPFPGTEKRRPNPIPPIEGLVLAGDWVQTGVPSCMEGAVRSGRLAAEHILAQSGRPEKLALDQAPMGRLARVIHLASPRRAIEAALWA